MPPTRTSKRNNSSPSTSNAVVPASSAITLTSTSNPTTQKVPRPPNCWIYFRKLLSNLFQAFCASDTIPEQKALSSIISQIWELFSDDDKQPFVYFAWELKVVHEMRHPDYVFRPKRKTEEEKREAKEKKERRALVKQAKEAACAQQKKMKKSRASQKRVVAESVPLAALPYVVGSSTALASRATSSQLMLPPSNTSSSMPQELQSATASSSNGSMHNAFHNAFSQQTQFGPHAGLGTYGQASIPQNIQLSRLDIPVSLSSNGRGIGYTPTFESGSSPSLSFSPSEGDVMPPMTPADAASPFIEQTQSGLGIQQMQMTMIHSQLPRLDIPISYSSSDESLGYTPTSEGGSPPSLSFSDSEVDVGSPMTPMDADSPPFVRTATPAGWGYDTSESNMTQHVNVGDWANSTSSSGWNSSAQAQAHDANVQELTRLYGYQPPVDGWYQNQNQNQDPQGLFVPSEFELDNMVPDHLDAPLAQTQFPDYSHHHQTQPLPDTTYDFSAFQYPGNGDAQFDTTDTSVLGFNEELDVSLADFQASLAQFTPAEIAEMLQGLSEEE
ncbi:hypothetical protein PM082_021827 [Marasmius tenuissimus]|nr:hypothetical protein PM082_021827 [Marasmius tenuissimus]